jgi:hypothetical protein
VQDVHIVIVKFVNGLCGCHRESLILLVRPEFLLNMRGAQGGKVQAREVMGYIEDLTSSFPLWSAM